MDDSMLPEAESREEKVAVTAMCMGLGIGWLSAAWQSSEHVPSRLQLLDTAHRQLAVAGIYTTLALVYDRLPVSDGGDA